MVTPDGRAQEHGIYQDQGVENEAEIGTREVWHLRGGPQGFVHAEVALGGGLQPAWHTLHGLRPQRDRRFVLAGQHHLPKYLVLMHISLIIVQSPTPKYCALVLKTAYCHCHHKGGEGG